VQSDHSITVSLPGTNYLNVTALPLRPTDTEPSFQDRMRAPAGSKAAGPDRFIAEAPAALFMSLLV
jgi:hypothetical protein